MATTGNGKIRKDDLYELPVKRGTFLASHVISRGKDAEDHDIIIVTTRGVYKYLPKGRGGNRSMWVRLTTCCKDNTRRYPDLPGREDAERVVATRKDTRYS